MNAGNVAKQILTTTGRAIAPAATNVFTTKNYLVLHCQNDGRSGLMHAWNAAELIAHMNHVVFVILADNHIIVPQLMAKRQSANISQAIRVKLYDEHVLFGINRVIEVEKLHVAVLEGREKHNMEFMLSCHLSMKIWFMKPLENNVWFVVQKKTSR